MSAELLIKAAGLLRERAEAATPGPWEQWKPEGWSAYNPGVVQPGVDPRTTGSAGWVAECGPYEDTGHLDAAYIATMHPLVALALADWLSRAADLVESSNGIPSGRGLGYEQAVAVARAVLGESS